MMYSFVYAALSLAFTAIVVACDDPAEPPKESLPVLGTAQVSGITPSSAISGGSIISDGGTAVTARGVCWSTASRPTIDDDTTSDGTGTGSFVSAIAGLSENTRYSVRAYATNRVGTAYGDTVTFTTSMNIQVDYLGQTPPGLTPVPFAHHIFGQFPLHSSPAFSPHGDIVLWSIQNASPPPGVYALELWCMRRVDGTWNSPQKASFILNGIADSPTFSPDGRRMYFISAYPTPGDPDNTTERIWYSNRTEDGWSEAELLGQEFDSYILHWQVSVVDNGNLYFSGCEIDAGFERDICLAHYAYSEYVEFFSLGDSVNIPGEIETTPWVAPDESYLIFSRGGATSFSDLYISFKGPGGAWTEAKNMVGVNSPYHDLNPIVTPDGKYLMFTSGSDGGPYWVDASVVESFR